eukprot:2444065-Pyramimonas_sp.AAC.1
MALERTKFQKRWMGSRSPKCGPRPSRKVSDGTSEPDSGREVLNGIRLPAISRVRNPARRPSLTEMG